MLDTISSAIEETNGIDGDIIFFRVYKGDIIIRLLKNNITNKNFFIVHNSSGLEVPTIFDFEKDNKTCLYKKGRFAYSRKDLINRLGSNLKNEKNRYTIADYRNVEDAVKKISKIAPSICVLDLIQAEPTQIALDFCWEKIPLGGKIIITNYKQNSERLSSKSVDEFIQKNLNDITTKVNIIEKCVTISKIKQESIIVEEPELYSIQNVENKLVISCVLKTGGIYDHNYVNALANAIRRNVTIPYEFVCLTDDSSNFNSNVDTVIPFKHDYKKWWGKIELFRPDIFQGKQVFFLDLDTVIIDNIDNIVSKQFEFCGLRDFYKTVTLGSGLMSWQHDKYHHVYERFVKNSTYIMNNTPEGDQRWINENVKSMKYFQDIFGNNVVSYKKDCVKNKAFRIPKNTKIVCFHGLPKPHQIDYPEIRDHWTP